MSKKITEARDSGGQGFNLNRMLVEFNFAKNITEANDLIRTGQVELDNNKVKDILYPVVKGTFFVKVRGQFAELTIL